MEMLAKTQFGLEEILADELKNLGAQNIELLNRAVKFSGDTALLYRANLELRTAIKILVPIFQFEFKDQEDFYKQVRKYDWSKNITTEQTLAINSAVNSEHFTHSKFVALKTKDAIVDQFRDTFGVRPSIDTADPDLRINVHIFKNQCTLSLDSSGSTLAKRGYRKVQSKAPISEVLAAGIILLSKWNPKTDFMDPMCGSGTFPIEAAMIASNMAPGLNRTFAFQKWNDFDRELWSDIRRKAKEKIKEPSCKIVGSDMDFKVLNIARNNAELAGVDRFIKFRMLDFLDSESMGNSYHIAINPPYGERIGNPDRIRDFYRAIGDSLKQGFANSDAWIISSDIEALKNLGLKASRRIKLYNGPLECRLYHFELYSGSRQKTN